MGCWRWFNGILKEAGVEVTDENRDKIDEVIHEYIGEQASYGRCSSNWRQARGEIRANEPMRRELIGRLQAIA